MKSPREIAHIIRLARIVTVISLAFILLLPASLTLHYHPTLIILLLVTMAKAQQPANTVMDTKVHKDGDTVYFR